MIPDKKKLISYGLLVGMFLVVCIFLYKYIDHFIDADMSSELVLARLLADEGKLLTASWYYSTELRVLNTQMVFAPLFALFEHWHTVRVVGTGILFLLLLGSFAWLCRQSGMWRLFPFLGTLLLLPLSDEYFEFVIIGAYYFPHIMISFLTIALNLQYIRTDARRKRIVLLALAVILALLAGLGGLRQLFVLYVPLMVSSVLTAVMRKDFQSRRFLCASGLECAASVIGYLINSCVFSRWFHFQGWSEMEYIPISLNNLMDCINGILKAFGYHTGKLFSAATLYNLVFAGVVVVIVWGICSTLSNGNADTADVEITVYFLCALIVFVALYTVTNTAYFDRYNIPITIFVVPLLGIAYKNISLEQYIKKLIFASLVGGMIFCGALTYNDYRKQDYTVEQRNVAEFLQTNNYREGYTTFWNGNILTELSDGKIEVRVWTDVGYRELYDVDQVHEWLQETSHQETRPTGKVFLLFGQHQYAQTPLVAYLDKANIIYQSNDNIIFGYESYDTLMTDIHDKSEEN